jgi:O-antigen biosynthesis protein
MTPPRNATDGLTEMAAVPGSDLAQSPYEDAVDVGEESRTPEPADETTKLWAAPTEPERRKPHPIGSLDKVEHDEISGWVWDPQIPDEPVDIEILDDDVAVLRARAANFRQDLQEVGVGDGRHGFVLRGLAGVLPFSRHRVRVRRASDGRDLPGSPFWLTRPWLDERAIEFMNQFVTNAVFAATKAEDLAQPLSHVLGLLNDLVNGYEALARSDRQAREASAAEIAHGIGLSERMRELVGGLRLSYSPLYFEPVDAPDVSIIIPVYNKFKYTYDCLRSIQKLLPRRTFEIVIVDDCSEDETLLAPLAFAGAVRIVRNTKNLGFVRSCNAGAAVAKGRYLFFLNNDTLMKDGWLDELVETFEQVPNVGIAGSKLLFGDGRLQEVGGIIWRLGDGWNWGRDRDPSEPAYCYLRDSDYVSGAALMIERALFNELGGFDEHFAPAYYEDTDLAFRVRAKGKRVVVQPASQIVHLEGVSAGTDTAGSGMKRFQAINQHKFYQRWKDTLITHRLNGQMPELEAERTVTKRAYFIDDTVPTPDQDAGSNAAVDHMRLLMELGYKVTFLPADNMAKIDPYTARLQKLGIECLYHPFRWSVEEEFRKAQHKPDLVYLHRHTNASKYATMVRRYFPDARIVYSVADLHFLRMERQAEVEKSADVAEAAARQRHAEMAAMSSVDCVIVHSPVEAGMLHEAEPGLAVQVVPWTIRLRPTPKPFAERSGIAFVGGFGHPPNVDAAEWLASEIVPLLRKQVPEATTYLVGSNMPDAVAKLAGPGVVAVGWVPELADMLHRVRATVVPLRYGAGIKGKVLESFAHGLPCVMTPVAAEGLELPKALEWLVADGSEEIAGKLVRVNEDAAFNAKLAEAGLAYIEGRYGAAAIREALRGAVRA